MVLGRWGCWWCVLGGGGVFGFELVVLVVGEGVCVLVFVSARGERGGGGW